MTKLSIFAPFSRLAMKLFCVCLLIVTVSSALAQQGGGTHPAPPPPQPPVAPPPKPPTPTPPANFPSANNPWDQNELIQRSNNKLVSPMTPKSDNCFLPPLNGLLRSGVAVADLQI